MNVRAYIFALILTIPSLAAAQISITEVMYDVSGTDTKREWIEVRNDGDASVDVSKWKIADKSNHVINTPPKNGGRGSTVLASGNYAIIAADGLTFTSEYPQVQNVLDSALSLNNETGTISLLNASGTLIASVAYGKTYGAAGDGDSLQYTGSAWIHAAPTPGESNATTPSEPKPQAASAAVAKKSVAKTPSKKEKNTRERLDTPHTQPADEMADQSAADSNDSYTAAAATQSLGSSIWYIAGAALAIGTGAIAALISRGKKEEWDIVEE